MITEDKSYEDLQNYSILIIEDDTLALSFLANIMRRYFKNVITAANGNQAGDIVLSQHIDIILTDMRMPYQDGADFVKQLLELDLNIPVIFMSAYTDSETLLRVIPLNIADYLIKPIEIDKVLALAKKSLEGKAAATNNNHVEKNIILLVNGITIDMMHKVVSKDNEMIFLTKKEFELLTLFIKNKYSVLSKTQIEYAIWYDEMTSESSVKTLIKKLRSKIGEEAIITVKNIGYKINILL